LVNVLICASGKLTGWVLFNLATIELRQPIRACCLAHEAGNRRNFSGDMSGTYNSIPAKRSLSLVLLLELPHPYGTARKTISDIFLLQNF